MPGTLRRQKIVDLVSERDRRGQHGFAELGRELRPNCRDVAARQQNAVVDDDAAARSERASATRPLR
jgi:hypothetical protein